MEDTFFLTVAILTCAITSADSVTGQQQLKEKQNKQLSPLADDLGSLHVFIQISDLHISKFYDRARVSDLEVFCKKNIDLIKPEVVLASGDLTDAKYADLRGSMQYVEEWSDYQRVLQRSGVLNKTVWFDIRGNHDAFNVASLDDPANLYRFSSPSGDPPDGYYCGRYASYWNAFLLEMKRRNGYKYLELCIKNAAPECVGNYFQTVEGDLN